MGRGLGDGKRVRGWGGGAREVLGVVESPGTWVEGEGMGWRGEGGYSLEHEPPSPYSKYSCAGICLTCPRQSNNSCMQLTSVCLTARAWDSRRDTLKNHDAFNVSLDVTLTATHLRVSVFFPFYPLPTPPPISLTPVTQKVPSPVMTIV